MNGNTSQIILRLLVILGIASISHFLIGQDLDLLRPATPSIVIGISNVQSGPSRALGEKVVEGSQAYFDVVNHAGGIHGRHIDIILKDDRYEPDPAIQNTNDLITKDKVFFLFDYVGTATLTRVLPLLKYYEGQEIVNVAPFTGADTQRKPPYDKYVFNIRASYREETQALVRYFYSKGYRRIAYFGQADAYGKSAEIGARSALATHGLNLVAIAGYRRNSPFETSMKEQVEILRSQGADAVIAVGAYGPCAAFIRDARMAGWKIPIANVSFVNADAMLDLLVDYSAKAGQDLTSGLINSQVVPSPNETGFPLVASYRAHFPKKRAGSVSLEGWLNAAVVSEALRRAGSNPSRAAFIKAMESLKGWDPGLGIKLEFSPTNHQGMHKVWLTKTEHGQWVTEQDIGAIR
ncbi:MAG TPA: ABC transporter substrate-binding protein [Candidatus Dormibacteraeota bacterium]|nr:ABC transporter substrate-binding protein [Candidatus Dormibacteraeota bacterium]